MGMGLDPPKKGETHEVVVQLEGPCSRAAFDQYAAALKKCLDMLAETYDLKRVRRIVRQPRRTARPRRRRGSRR